MINIANAKLIYLRVYDKLKLKLLSNQRTISAEELMAMIRHEYKLCHFRTDKANLHYTLGFFRKNKVVVPDGCRLKISISNESVRV